MLLSLQQYLPKFVFMLAALWLTGCEAVEAPKRQIEMLCGGYKWVIACGRDSTPKSDDRRECNNNTLSYTAPDGKTTVIKDPPLTTEFHDDRRPVMLEGTTPRAMSCLPKQDATYVSIEYSRDPSTVGLFYEWFKSDGTRLTTVWVPLQQGFKDPTEGINWRDLPKRIQIEEE